MGYNKKYDTRDIDELVEILENVTEDGEYNLQRVKSPKNKRHQINLLTWHNSILGRLIELKKIKAENKKTLLTIFTLITVSVNAQKDQVFHFLVNSHGVPAIGITMYQMGYNQAKSIFIPAAVMGGISLAKEISDKQRGGIISKPDLFADARGIVAGAFITMVVNGLIQHVRDNRAVKHAYRNYKPVEF